MASKVITINKFLKGLIAFCGLTLVACASTPVPAVAQTASILPNARTQFIDSNGNPLVGGTVGFYIPGTLTAKTTWQNQGQTVANANPLTLDALGSGLIWGFGSYREIVKNSSGTVIWDGTTSSVGSSSGGGSSGLTNTYDITSATYGCVPSGSTSGTDQATCINAAITAAASSGGGIVWVPDGFWNLKSQVHVKQNVTLQCVANGFMGDASLESYANTAPGATFAVLWGTGSGASDDLTKAAVKLDQSAQVRDCGFWYPSQSNTAVTPTEYGSSIAVGDGALNANQVASGNWCAKCYNFIDFRGSLSSHYLTQPIVEKNSGGCLNVCVLVNYYADWGQPFGNGNHFNAGQINESDSSGSFLRGWTATHGRSFYVGHSDWILMQAPQAWGYNIGIDIDYQTVCCGAYVAHGPVIIQNGQMDAMSASDINVSGWLLDLRILGSTGTAFNQFTIAPGIFLGGGATAQIDSLTLADGYTFAPMQNIINLAAGVSVGDVSISNWHTANAASAQYAFEFPTGAATTSLLISGTRVVGYAGGLYYPSTFTNAPTTIGSF